MAPVEGAPRGDVGFRESGVPRPRSSGRNTQGNFGFDAAAWDPLAVLAAQVEERFQRPVRRRIGEVLDLLQQVAAEAGLTARRQEIQALAFCLVDALSEGSGVPPATRARLLQMVACHALTVDQEVGAGERSYWFYLNLMLKRFQQLRVKEGLEPAVRAALRGCSPLLERNPQVVRELAVELLEMLAVGGRSLSWRGVSSNAVGPAAVADAGHPAPGDRPVSRDHVRAPAGRPTASCAPPLSAGRSGT
ncbi:MAG TPA: hypothetical protein VK997_15240 [Deferrisomatales bacterium]|nr:hypothetical protein [Deferrisomatales bacterium]